MELRHLRYFVALAEELHFTRAAERLNISPPTLTVQIQEIERTLAAQLFVRTRRSVTLTSAGKVFLSEAQRVMEQFSRAENAGRRAGRGELGRIEIGYVGSATYTGVLQDQMNRFAREHPGVYLNARELPMESLPQLIEDLSVHLQKEKEAILRTIQTVISRSEAIRYIQLGNPENILIDDGSVTSSVYKVKESS